MITDGITEAEIILTRGNETNNLSVRHHIAELFTLARRQRNKYAVGIFDESAPEQPEILMTTSFLVSGKEHHTEILDNKIRSSIMLLWIREQKEQNSEKVVSSNL